MSRHFTAAALHLLQGTHPTRALWRAGLALALVAGLAGCGGGSDTATVVPPAPPAPPQNG